MAIPSFITHHKPAIDSYLADFLTECEPRFDSQPQVKDLLAYLKQFSRTGKSIRGGLFLEFLSLAGQSAQEVTELLPVAASLELIHSALLIQDDWMDQDDLRRGGSSFHSLLRAKAISAGIHAPEKYSGEATNCAVDVIIFLAFELFGRVKNSNMSELIQFTMQEYLNVGFAQWQDVYFSYQTSYQQPDIARIYRYKTARYTFVMPIVAALLASGKKRAELALIEQLTENLGMIFQITDDRLNIFGDSALTKKNTGSDIADNKKTYYHFFFHQLLNQHPELTELQAIQPYFGKKDFSPAELQQVKKVFQDFGIEQQVNEILVDFQTRCQSQIDQLAAKNIQAHCQELLEYLLERQS